MINHPWQTLVHSALSPDGELPVEVRPKRERGGCLSCAPESVPPMILGRLVVPGRGGRSRPKLVKHRVPKRSVPPSLGLQSRGWAERASTSTPSTTAGVLDGQLFRRSGFTRPVEARGVRRPAPAGPGWGEHHSADLRAGSGGPCRAREAARVWSRGGVVQSGESGAPVFAPRLVQGVIITEAGLFRMILVTAPSIVITSPAIGIPGGCLLPRRGRQTALFAGQPGPRGHLPLPAINQVVSGRRVVGEQARQYCQKSQHGQALDRTQHRQIPFRKQETCEIWAACPGMWPRRQGGANPPKNATDRRCSRGGQTAKTDREVSHPFLDLDSVPPRVALDDSPGRQLHPLQVARPVGLPVRGVPLGGRRRNESPELPAHSPRVAGGHFGCDDCC